MVPSERVEKVAALLTSEVAAQVAHGIVSYPNLLVALYKALCNAGVTLEETTVLVKK